MPFTAAALAPFNALPNFGILVNNAAPFTTPAVGKAIVAVEATLTSPLKIQPVSKTLNDLSGSFSYIANLFLIASCQDSSSCDTALV